MKASKFSEELSCGRYRRRVGKRHVEYLRRDRRMRHDSRPLELCRDCALPTRTAVPSPLRPSAARVPRLPTDVEPRRRRLRTSACPRSTPQLFGLFRHPLNT